jgi:hypothetical protein
VTSIIVTSIDAVRTVRLARVGVTRCHNPVQTFTGSLKRILLRVRVQLHRLDVSWETVYRVLAQGY